MTMGIVKPPAAATDAATVRTMTTRGGGGILPLPVVAKQAIPAGGDDGIPLTRGGTIMIKCDDGVGGGGGGGGGHTNSTLEMMLVGGVTCRLSKNLLT